VWAGAGTEGEGQADSTLSVEPDAGLSLITPRAGCLTEPPKCPRKVALLNICWDPRREGKEGQRPNIYHMSTM